MTSAFRSKSIFQSLQEVPVIINSTAKLGRAWREGPFEAHRLGSWVTQLRAVSPPTAQTQTHSLTQRTMLWIIGFTLVHLFRPKPICFPISYRWSFRDNMTFKISSVLGLKTRSQISAVSATLRWQSIMLILDSKMARVLTKGEFVFRAAGVYDPMGKPYTVIINNSPEVML